ncbi:MAG TPA: transglutaminaseTgpA domain-containing protein [Acidothermaceae bacterium]
MSGSAVNAEVVNARASRISLLVGGAAAQFAVMPLLSGLADAIAMTSFLAIGIATIRLPLPAVAPGTRPGGFKLTMAPRQATALVLIMLGAVLVLGRVNAFDANSKAAALATLLLVVQVAHCLALQTRREAALGCAIAIVMLSVGAAFAGDVTLLLPVIVALPAVAVTAALLHRGSLIDAADVTSTGGAGAIVRACLTPVTLATGLGLVVFLLLPNTSHLHTHTHFINSDTATATDAGSGTAASGAGSRSASNPGAGSIDLRARGALSNASVFEVPATSPAYWQAAVFTEFDGTHWTTSGPLTRWSGSTSAGGTQVAPADLARAANETTQQYTVRVLQSTGLDVVIGPGRPVAYTGTGVVTTDRSGTAHLGGGPSNGGTYAVVSAVPQDQSDAALLSSTGSEAIDAQSLEIPADLPARVTQLAASLVAGAESRLAAVNAVDDYLRANETYNLNSPEPGRSVDAVDDFLFVSHQGFCEQFATAAVVMLRSQGIPARLVSGYVDGDLTAVPGERVFRGSDAHAWVQVYYPGVGWVNSDPTAGSIAQVSGHSVRQRIGAALTRLWHRVPGGRWGALLGVALAFVLGVGLAEIGRRWLRRRRRFTGVDRGRVGDGPILAAYLRLDVALHGVERAREPSESLGELARRLGGFVATPAEVASAVSFLERESYGVDPPSTAETAEAIGVFDRLRDAVGRELVAVAANAPST